MIWEETDSEGRPRKRLVVICLALEPGDADEVIGVWAAGTRLDADVTILVRDIPGILGNLKKKDRVSIVKIPFPEKTPTLRSEIRCARLVLSQTRSTDNLLFSPHDSYAFLAALLAMFLSRPVTTISIVHRQTQSLFSSRLRERILGISERILFRRSKAVGAASGQAAMGLAKIGIPKEKLHLIPRGVDVGRFWNCRKDRLSVRQKLGFTDDVFVVGVRASAPFKEDLLALFQRFSATPFPGRIAWAVCGLEALPQDFREQIEKLPLNTMVLAASTEDADFYAAIDLLLVPSFSDEAQRTLLEAMSSGVPGIVADEGNNALLVNDGVTGWLVPGGNPDAVASKVQAIAAMPNERLRGAGWAARHMVTSNFSTLDLIASLDQLYRWGWE